MAKEIISLYIAGQKTLPIAKKLDLRYSNVKYIIDDYEKRKKNT
jgi:hypothetical protein